MSGPRHVSGPKCWRDWGPLSCHIQTSVTKILLRIPHCARLGESHHVWSRGWYTHKHQTQLCQRQGCPQNHTNTRASHNPSTGWATIAFLTRFCFFVDLQLKSCDPLAGVEWAPSYHPALPDPRPSAHPANHRQQSQRLPRAILFFCFVLTRIDKATQGQSRNVLFWHKFNM